MIPEEMVIAPCNLKEQTMKKKKKDINPKCPYTENIWDIWASPHT